MPFPQQTRDALRVQPTFGYRGKTTFHGLALDLILLLSGHGGGLCILKMRFEIATNAP